MREDKANKMEGFKVVVPQEFSAWKVWSLLVTAFEGGSNYWYIITNHNCEELDLDYVHECPLHPEGFVEIEDQEEGKGRTYLLNRQALQKGLEIFARDEPRHFSDFVLEKDDADTADVFLQCCTFGEAIYG